MVIVDTNIIAYLFLPMPLTAKAELLFLKDPLWITSPLWRYEFYSILSRYLRTSRLQEKDAFNIMQKAESLFKNKTFPSQKKTFLKLLSNSNSSPYDIEFIAVAEDFNQKLLTADKKILKAFPERTENPFIEIQTINIIKT